MRRRFAFMTIVFVFLIVLTSCKSKKKEDKIEIFDSNDIKIAETEKQDELDYFSDFIEMSEDAIKSYHFIFTNGNEGTKIDFYIYENYPYITMEGVPMITTPLTWELSKEDLKEFNDKVQELKDLDNKR